MMAQSSHKFPILIPNDEALLPHKALPVTPDWKRNTRGSQQLVLRFSEEKPTSKKRKKKSLLLLSKPLSWEGLEVTFWSISAVLGEPFHKCWGWIFPARVWWLVTHQKEVFLLFCVSFCVGQSMTNQVPAVICPRPSHDILSQDFTALLPANTSSPRSSCWERHFPPLWGFNEELASWACLQNFPIFLWKMPHLFNEKARRGLRELCNCAVQKGISSQEAATTCALK